MRYIDKRNKEPEELAKYRETTPDATYDGFSKKGVVRKSLCEEQGYICAYCMGKIEKDNSTIEHYISQRWHTNSKFSAEEHRAQSLLYSNMCGVCVNDAEHCDKHRGNEPLEILNPHDSSCQQLITYNLQGEIIPNGKNNQQNKQVEKDINTLNLNCEKLKKARNASWDEVWERFKEEYKKETWTKKLFKSYAERYQQRTTKKGVSRFHAYCHYIVWCFNYYSEKNKYK